MSGAHWFWSSTNTPQVVYITKTVAKSIAKTPANYMHQNNAQQTQLHIVNKGHNIIYNNQIQPLLIAFTIGDIITADCSTSPTM